ncbi:hypothetical protein V496_00032 [Pseudogymnoascus sp. VKM F-4515 (FW-2607)]|nr:hypothetical protein V496_00032 [Pseudogymnoascus sp. VKM F-4515 (FW-2607)]
MARSETRPCWVITEMTLKIGHAILMCGGKDAELRGLLPKSSQIIHTAQITDDEEDNEDVNIPKSWQKHELDPDKIFIFTASSGDQLCRMRRVLAIAENASRPDVRQQPLSHRIASRCSNRSSIYKQ